MFLMIWFWDPLAPTPPGEILIYFAINVKPKPLADNKFEIYCDLTIKNYGECSNKDGLVILYICMYVCGHKNPKDMRCIYV